MQSRFTLQQRGDAWMYVLCFGEDTPTEIEAVKAYSDNCTSAEDSFGARHYVFSKDGFLVAVALHDALRLLPYLDPERPETMRMPGMRGIMFGNPPVPTLLLEFREKPPDNRTAYAISSNVYLIFQGPELALLYVLDASKVIADAG